MFAMQGLELLGQAGPALQMGARERAIYLHKLAEAKQAQDPGVKEEEEATLAGNNLAALRSWFRQVRPWILYTQEKLTAVACSGSWLWVVKLEIQQSWSESQ